VAGVLAGAEFADAHSGAHATAESNRSSSMSVPTP
jgi:hypothetical protein